MAAVTLQDLINRALDRADMQSNAGTSAYNTTQSLTYLANAAHARLYDILVGAFEDHYMLSTTFSLVAGKEYYDLSADLNLVDASSNPTFYKIREMFLTTGTGTNLNRLKLRKFNTNELSRLNNSMTASISLTAPVLFYRLSGTRLYFEPIAAQNTAGYSVEMWYVPQVTKLVNLTDALDYQTVYGWDEYLVNDMAINLKIREESDPQMLMARQQEFERKIEAMAANRDIAEPERVTDVYDGYNTRYPGVF